MWLKHHRVKVLGLNGNSCGSQAAWKMDVRPAGVALVGGDHEVIVRRD